LQLGETPNDLKRIKISRQV